MSGTRYVIRLRPCMISSTPPPCLLEWIFTYFRVVIVLVGACLVVFSVLRSALSDRCSPKAWIKSPERCYTYTLVVTCTLIFIFLSIRSANHRSPAPLQRMFYTPEYHIFVYQVPDTGIRIAVISAAPVRCVVHFDSCTFRYHSRITARGG